MHSSNVSQTLSFLPLAGPSYMGGCMPCHSGTALPHPHHVLSSLCLVVWKAGVRESSGQ